MEEIVKINNNDLAVKMWNSQRVVTLSDIDKVHNRPSGTARRNFNENKKHLILNEDYIVRNSYEAKQEYNIVAPNGLTLFTESGYLLLVKSFTDDLAWSVQRDLVNTYFKFQEVVQDFNSGFPINTIELNAFLAEAKKNLPCVYAQINNIEERLESVIENMTLSTRQQEKIHETARKRVNHLLGGAHSPEYKLNARSYIINLWNGLKATYHCGSSYKDLHPEDFDKAIQYINDWTYDD